MPKGQKHRVSVKSFGDRHRCLQCGYTAAGIVGMRMHARYVHSRSVTETIVIFKCAVCGKSFDTAYELERHHRISANHTGSVG